MTGLLLLDFASGPLFYVMSLMLRSWGHVAVSVLLHPIQKNEKQLAAPKIC